MQRLKRNSRRPPLIFLTLLIFTIAASTPATAVEVVKPGWTAKEHGLFFTEDEARSEYAIDMTMEKQLAICMEGLETKDMQISELQDVIGLLNDENADLRAENKKLAKRKWGAGIAVGIRADGQPYIGLGVQYNFVQW